MTIQKKKDSEKLNFRNKSNYFKSIIRNRKIVRPHGHSFEVLSEPIEYDS